ncbi:protein-lysine N-methyltransferase EEF2KMT-like isoform X2 [Pongo abelii]|uniref:protein-lysine N-methyltransferase EEF2KMT-like isoform X2 n=1 Tax=Pongo abelii TaxID=9601 RepID=UPI003007E265
MAPEENAGTELLLQSFERRFLAARILRSFPWQSLEAKLRHSSDSELLRDILQKASGGSVILSESTAIISHGTTGLVTWDAALYLAEWAIENPAAFTHRRAVLPRSHRVAGRGPAEAGCLLGAPAGSCHLSGLHCPQPRDGPAVHHGAR